MALNGTFTWKLLCTFCLKEMSRLLEMVNIKKEEFSKLHTKYGVVALVYMHIKMKLKLSGNVTKIQKLCYCPNVKPGHINIYGS